MGAKELVILLVCSTVLACIVLVHNTKDVDDLQAHFQEFAKEAMQVGAAPVTSAVPPGVLISETTAASEVQQTDSVLPAAGALKDLTRELREAAFRANGGKPVDPLSETVRNEWHKNNPCMSREKLPLRYAARKFVKDLNVSAAWDAVFREYEILHRTCTTKVQLNISHSDLHQRDTTSGCDYLVCEPTAMSGLGNRILAAASCMIYAVLTQRVLLLPSSSLLAEIMCEPFEGSSWKVNEGSIDLPVLSKFWASTDQFLSAVDSSMGSLSKDTLIPNRAIKLHATDFTAELRFHPDKRFFCGTEQNLLRGVTWLYLTSNQYFLPKLFLIPKFRTALEALFPTRMVLTHALRYSMLPGDVVWQRVEQVHAMQPDRTDRRLGVQIRTNRQFQELHLILEARIKQCALDNGMLPQHGLAASDLNKSSQSTNYSSTEESIPAVQSVIEESSDNVNRTTVFIASLYNDFELSLRSEYLRNPPANGENVTVVQLSNRLEQTLNSREEDEQALTEIILLSLCDDIIVTPSSTFGGVAKAYGALLPWVIETQSNDVGCVRGPTVDACYGVPARYLSCLYDDPELRGRSVVDVLPYLKDCFPGEIVGGIQVMTLQ